MLGSIQKKNKIFKKVKKQQNFHSPHLSVGVIITYGVPGLLQLDVVPSARLQQLDHAEPITELLTEIHGEVAEMDQSNEALRTARSIVSGNSDVQT